MRDLFRRILAVDRRWIFLLVFLALAFPILVPLNLPGLRPSAPARALHKYVEDLPPNSKVLVSMDFDPASKPELQPMGAAVLRHFLERKHKVVVMTLWVTGTGLTHKIVEEQAKAVGAEYGKDYVNLGWKPGGFAVITGMGEDIRTVYPKDARNNATDSLPIMNGIRKLKDFDLIFSFAAGTPGLDTWIAYAGDRHKIPMGGGSTAVNEPSMAPYIQSGQLVGFIGALRGAAEYENLMHVKGDATRGMDGITLGHYLIIVLIVVANIGYFVLKTPKGAA